MAIPTALVTTDRIFTGIGCPRVTAICDYIDFGGTLSEFPIALFSGYLDPPKIRTVTMHKQEIVHTYVKSGSSLNWVQGIWFEGTFKWDKIGWSTAALLMKMLEFEKTKLTEDSEGNQMLLWVHHDDPIPLSIIMDTKLSFPYIADKHVGHSASISWRGMLRWPYTACGATSETDIEDFFTDTYRSW